ncbi:MAG: LpxL/LpxP family Kdo(2)-lipid IV(A) lauroyl/palmitoleoyl acyltransferase [Gammaproteobacteria bacterium]|nr:LpxL/LpxP family Kdo(2)-lipid IV(A) lauroyl/palmitoleoyl acyltransferase [Gammaproteobacteria bacterium]
MTEQTELRWQHVLLPQHWPIWLVVGLLRLFAWIPYPLQRVLGWLIGWLLFIAAGRRRRVTQMNIDLCYPERSKAERRKLVHGHFQALGMSVFEIAMCWYGADWVLRRRVKVEGLQYLDAALAEGKGALLLSAHFTTLEIGGRLLGLFRNFHLMYRPNRTELLEIIISTSRRRHFEKVIPRDDVRSMLRSLKENHPVWYAPDQGFRGKNSAEVPFFGVPAPTNTATSRIARSTGSPVLPFMVERLPGLQGYKLTIDPPLEGFPGEDPAEDAARVNAIIEADARRVPDQYLWCHNRFKRPYKR